MGRVDGQVIFVPWTVPQDRIRAKITEVKKKFLIGEMTEILSPSPFRRPAPCPVFGECGGCTWQNVDYSVQISEKEKIVASALKKFSDVEILPFLKAKSEFRYRNRIQLQKESSRVGFFARGSRSLVDIQDCWITEEPIAQAIRGLENEAQDGRFELSRDRFGSLRIDPVERDPESALFTQVNSEQNQTMIRVILEWTKAYNPKRVFDLYCGSGNLTFPLSQQFNEADVHGVELSRDAIRAAKAVSSNINWHSEDVGVFLKRQKLEDVETLVILDPPRVGVSKEVIASLAKIRPTWFIYVSCNPMTFARDAALFSSEFSLKRVQGLDMFPQTEHVELIAQFAPH